jgi:hypothetical protein
MAQKFLTNIDLNQNQILNATFEKLATDPASGNFEGRLIYNTATDTIKVYTGAAFVSIPHTIVSGGGAGIAEALTVSESNGTITLTLAVADTDSAGLLPAAMWQMLTDATPDATNSKLVKRDANGNAKVADPTDNAHIATKGYVDAARQGLDVKASVRVASVAPVAIASALEAGDVIDGVTLVAGDRVLLKDQSTASENGIYVAVASGAASRADDANTSAKVTTGMFTFVSEGTVNGDNGFVLTTNDAITLGTTGLDFVQFSGAGQVIAGAGLTKSGNTLDVVGTADRITVNADSVDIASTYAGQNTITTLGTITTGTWDATTVAVTAGGTGVETFTDNGIVYGDGTNALDVTAAGTQYQVLQAGSGGVPEFGALSLSSSAAVTGQLPIANGGTSASTAVDARINLGTKTSAGAATTSTSALARIAKQACAASAAGTSTTVVTHLFNSLDVIVQIYEVSSGATVIGDTVRTNADTVTVTLLGTITAGDYVIVVTG